MRSVRRAAVLVPLLAAGALAAVPADAAVTGLRIHDIQGATHTSPYEGDDVSGVTGVVTAVGYSQFWIEDRQPDADPATSEGIQVYTAGEPDVSVGDVVSVDGTVTEYRPGGDDGYQNLSTTELGYVTVTVTGQAAVPAPALVGPGGLVPPARVIEDDATGDVQTSGYFDPARDGLDFWESLEGMRLRIDNASVVGPSNQYGETAIVPARSSVRTARGGIVAQAGDFNPERVLVTDDFVDIPTANVGDTFAGPTIGVLDYSFGNFNLLATQAPTLVSGGLQRESTSPAGANQLSIATFNVENLSPQDDQAKFDTLGSYVVDHLAAPDIVTLEEVQDNTGSTDNGVVTANVTLRQLVDAITAAGGPAYEWTQIDPQNNLDGGEPGGNIRVAMLYRSDRGPRMVSRGHGDATTATQVVARAGMPRLTLSPGRIAPMDEAWAESRKPLAAEFRWKGRSVFVIANHFNSKGGDDPLFGHYQPIQEISTEQRHRQATLVRDFVRQITAIDPSAAVVVAGDINDFDFSQTVDILTDGGTLYDLPQTLPERDRYTYVYQGNSEVLDHILLSPAAYGWSREYDIVHVNAEFADQISDHDPQVVRLTVPGRP